jgi:hypothetical protein
MNAVNIKSVAFSANTGSPSKLGLPTSSPDREPWSSYPTDALSLTDLASSNLHSKEITLDPQSGLKSPVRNSNDGEILSQLSSWRQTEVVWSAGNNPHGTHCGSEQSYQAEIQTHRQSHKHTKTAIIEDKLILPFGHNTHDSQNALPPIAARNASNSSFDDVWNILP